MSTQSPDLDFKIHVDNSCLSTPMEDDTNPTNIEVEPGKQDKASLATEEISHDGEVPLDENEVPADPNDESELDVIAIYGRESSTYDRESSPAWDETADEQLVDPADDETTPDTIVGDKADDEPVEATPDSSELAEDADTPRPAHSMESEEEEAASRRESTHSDRKTSMRTEALIQAAARAVVARIEKQDKTQDSTQDDRAGEHSILSGTSRQSLGPDGSELTHDESAEVSRRSSIDSRLMSASSVQGSEGGGGDSSSHHEVDDDVFSDRSPRSSLGSYEGGAEETHSRSGDTVQHHDSESYRGSPRLSGISNLSQYEDDGFVPTARGTPRPAFRTPSAIRAIQMSSPTPSVFSSPRSSKRHTGISVGGLPTISRLGSPSVSAQYSPKGRSIPTRFKVKKEAPLVLLHATLLPLRWMWGEVLNEMDNVKGLESYEPSEGLKILKDSWRHLQCRVGDTVLERGILLAHPQNDYEILEERLLEALELPLRRRARILECGHYLGPANDTTLGEDEYLDSDDEFASQAGGSAAALMKRHWCSTCKSEIKLEELATDKIFRVKIFASNGLMRAGAWEACWKEMERVDAEVEPIVEPDLVEELEKLAILQMAERKRREFERREEERDLGNDEDTFIGHAHLDPSSPPILTSPVEPSATTTSDADVERRRRDEDRLREIYGHTPPPQASNEAADSMHPHPDSYIPPPSPPSPSEQAFERRQTRRRSYQTASLPELLLESARVVFQDRRNVVIALLSVFVMMLAVRTAPAPTPMSLQEAEILRDIYARHQQLDQGKASDTVVNAPIQEQGIVDTVTSAVPSFTTNIPTVDAVVVDNSSVVSDPCESPSSKNRHSMAGDDVSIQPPSANTALTPSGGAVTERKTVKVFETVTETVKFTATESADSNPTTEIGEDLAEMVVETVRVTATESAAPLGSSEGKIEL